MTSVPSIPNFTHVHIYMYIYIERVYATYSIMNDSEYDMRVTGATILKVGHNSITKVKLWNLY